MIVLKKGLEKRSTTSVILSAAIAVFYTMLGGLKAVAYTDILQISFLVIGLIVAVVYVVPTVGGLDASLTGYMENFGVNSRLFPPIEDFTSSDGLDGFIWLWLDFTLVFVFGGIPWQVYFQRVLSSESGKSARNMSILAGVACIIVGLVAAYVGALAVSFDFSPEALSTLAENPAQVFPMLLLEGTPHWVGILGVAAVAAAVMSTMDSTMLSSSTVFNRNVLGVFFPEKRDGDALQRGVKVGVILFGVLSTYLALQVKSVYALWFLCGETTYIGLFPLLLAAVYLRNVTPLGAGVGLAVSLFIRGAAGVQDLGIPPMFEFLSPTNSGYDGGYLPIRTIAMIAALMAQQMVSFVEKRLIVSPDNKLA